MEVVIGIIVSFGKTLFSLVRYKNSILLLIVPLELEEMKSFKGGPGDAIDVHNVSSWRGSSHWEVREDFPAQESSKKADKFKK